MDGADPMKPTGAQIAAIADTRTQTAQHTGCSEWDNGGIRAALLATEGPPADVLAAACLAAGDPKLNYPSEQALRVHWPKNATTQPRVSNDVMCIDHRDHVMPCTHRDHIGDMTPEQIAEAAAECKRMAAQAQAEAQTRRAEIENRRQEATR